MGNKGQLLLSHYPGSKSLSFLCTVTPLEIDQINFIACQFVALILSFILKRCIKDPKTRLIYCLVCGVFICNFCFGVQVLHVISSAGLSYLVIRSSQSSRMPWYVFTVSMLYLSWIHIWRQFFDLANGYSLDITGPLMVLTQKVTSLACAVNDGKKQKADKKITALQTHHAISELPDLLEYWSFIFQFQSFLTGPLVFFKEYREFIFHDHSPSPTSVVFKKLGGSIFFAILYLKVAPQFDLDYLREEDFLENTSFVYKLFYINTATSLERTKYYHAWILSDAVCNASGLGYKEDTNSWDLCSNVEAVEFELGLNLKESLDKWNKGTMRWLRYVVYERFSPNFRTLATYAASAMWHGFYPGYYITFLSGALFTSSARIIRKTVRPMFVCNRYARWSYHFITWLTTRLAVSYVSFTFVLLDFMPSIYVYLRLYFFIHVAAASAMLILPRMSKNMGKPRPSKISSNNNGIKFKKSLTDNSNLYIYSKVSYDDAETKKLKTG